MDGPPIGHPHSWETARMHEIVPDVFTWSWFSEPHGYTFNGHLVRDVGGNICIDPATPDEAVLEELADFGAAKILITNRNHSRAANLLRSRLGARTAIHPEDVGHARAQVTEIDDTLRPGDRPARGDRRSRQVARRGRAVMARTADPHRWRCGDRPSTRCMWSALRQGHGRSPAPQGQHSRALGS